MKSKQHVTGLCGALLMAAALIGAQPGTADAQGGPGAPAPQPPHVRGTVLGVQGYYEVLPSGAIVLYPSTPITSPGIMHTILGMFGGDTLVGRRGYFQISPAGELLLYFPPGNMWPGWHGGPAMGAGPMMPPSGGMPGMPAMPQKRQ
ncbi:MAG: hypothetical protein QNJ94_09085 [Alphaproteobacteria bacterium]|nr:hypothetical protein [Alphaproteobacteria bacterium]